MYSCICYIFIFSSHFTLFYINIPYLFSKRFIFAITCDTFDKSNIWDLWKITDYSKNFVGTNNYPLYFYPTSNTKIIPDIVPIWMKNHNYKSFKIKYKRMSIQLQGGIAKNVNQDSVEHNRNSSIWLKQKQLNIENLRLWNGLPWWLKW